MSDFTIRSDNVDVEQIMRQIRMRIKEKRGVDYTEEEIRELAKVKLEQFLDPASVRSDLVDQYRRRSGPRALENYTFEEHTIYQSSRAVVRFLRRLLNPVLKLFFNPHAIIQALHRQGEINALSFEVLNNLVVELTRLSIEVKNLRMRVEAMSTRLDFDERRARVFEGLVAPPAPAPGTAGREGGAETAGGSEAEAQEARRRRRRRRPRRRPESDGSGPPPGPVAPPSDSGPEQ